MQYWIKEQIEVVNNEDTITFMRRLTPKDVVCLSAEQIEYHNLQNLHIGQVVELETIPFTVVKIEKELKKWWQFWKKSKVEWAYLEIGDYEKRIRNECK